MPKLLDTDVEAEACQKCGATRPQPELRSEQGCANCSNLKLINDSIKNEKANREKQEAELKQLNADLKNLPDLDKPATSLYDNERGVWWFGINLKQPEANPISLLFIADQAKQQMLAAFGDWKAREEKRSRLTIGVRQSVKESITDILKTANKVSDKVKEIFTAKA